jgi:adenine-specific DNA-methyltransferase
MPSRPANRARKGPTRVESIRHQDARPNIPTADMHEQVPTQVEAPVSLKYPRNPDLDPQLVWRGKDSQDLADLRVDAPPIYIQEKIDPAVLIENLRDTANAGEIEPELTLFEGFDGLPQSDLVDFYQHSANWSNRMILGDSLQVMASLAEREMLRGKVQMVYMDPPYGIKFGSNWQLSLRKRNVQDGDPDEFAQEPEVVKAFRDTWELGIHSYLSYLRDRFTIARDLLNESGSIFVQIGDANVHLVRSLLDEVFGSENFKSFVTFRKSSPLGAKGLAGVADYIIWYAKNLGSVKERELFKPKGFGGDTLYNYVEEVDGTRRRMTADERQAEDGLPVGLRPFRQSPLISAGYTATCFYDFEYEGKTFLRQKYSWKTNREGMQRLIWAHRVIAPGRTPNYVRYFDDFPVMEYTNIWNDLGGATDLRYVVQTSAKVIERCLLMSTDPGDLVVDPTCGSGTTAFVAEQFGRRWITIDSSRVALTLAKERILGSRYPYYLLADSDIGRKKEFELSGTSIPASEAGHDVRQGFVYKRVPHITLASIAQNENIREGMTRDQINHEIAKSAEFEKLFDQPWEDGTKVRVAGPFTVESLTPHRSLELPVADSSVPEPKGTVDGIEFDQVILQNVRTAGIQNGLRKERIEFSDLTVHAGRYIQGVGTPKEGGENKVAIAVGPQYGTVSPQWIQSAAIEAKTIPGVKVLAVLGFAFDPQVRAVTDQYEANDNGIDTVGELPLGKLRVLMVRMNPDLLMGRDLRKTASANLFMVFGEPEIIWKRDGEKIVVEVKGVDVYDPIKDEIRSRSTDQIYLWMIDSNYDGKSFFMRHCYFLGEQEPYERLKRDLKADIDEEVWETLYKTTSRPFDPPSTGRIAVKVINDYGDEAMKVIEIK